MPRAKREPDLVERARQEARFPALYGRGPAYEVVPPYLLADSPPHALSWALSDMERMSAQGLDLLQIAARLGISEAVLSDAGMRFRDVALALTGGRARMWDQVSAVILEKALGGDTAAAKFLLETKGGFATPVVLQAEPPARPADRPAPVTLDHAQGLAAQQAALMARRKAQAG